MPVHPALDQPQLMRKINGKTLEMNVNDDNVAGLHHTLNIQE
jgi:hypothetical protein